MKSLALFIISIAGAFLLAGCGGAEPSPTATATLPPAATSAPSPTAVPSPTATATQPAPAALTTVRVMVPTLDNLQFVSFWVALGAGLFKEEGWTSNW